MEAVIFDGKEYVKASVVAERFKYTQDYLGQLCRGKKIDARLVGRAWYINLESLHGHKNTRYKAPEKKSESNEVPEPRNTQNFLSRIDVEPVLKKKTVKILRNVGSNLTEFPVKYESDDFSLIPRISREAVSKSVAILPAEAEELPVVIDKEFAKVTNFKSEPLPEVYLRGVLRVDGLPEIQEESDVFDNETQNPKIESPHHHIQSISKVETLINHQVSTAPTNIRKPIKIKLYRKEGELKDQISATKMIADVHGTVTKKVPSFTPNHSAGPQATPLVVRDVSNLQQKENVVRIPYATTKAAAILFVTILSSVGLLFSEQQIHIAPGSVSTDFGFSINKLHDVSSLLGR